MGAITITGPARLLAVALGLLAVPALAMTPAQASSASCPAAKPGKLTCAVLVRSPATARKGVLATPPAGYGPADLQAAYGLQATTEGMRQTVAVVEAGGDPNAEADLAIYRAQYGLPACSTADGCLTVVNQSGGTTLPPPVTGFTQQIPTDLDMVSAVCPNCHILLVEANDSAIGHLGKAVDTAVSKGAHIVDFSYFGPEDSSEVTQWDPYFNHPGVAITAAAGNSGYTGGPLNYPAASPDVTSVGGTVLDKAGATGCTASQGGNRGWCETAWSQTTSGCSQFETAKPAWQGATNCTGRADNDIAAVASSSTTPDAPVAVYDSYNAAGWVGTGETGVAAPIIAGIYADAGIPGATDNPAAYPYEHPGGGYVNPGTAYPYADGLNDVTSGSTGSCSPADLCTAAAGWDGPTGLGSPDSAVSLTASGSMSSPIYDDLGATTDTCADNSGNNQVNNNKIDIYECNGTGAQVWTLEADGSIHNGTSSFCMGVTGGGTANGTLIILRNCNGNASQEWRVMANGELINQNSGTCLDDSGNTTTNGTQLQIWNCNGNIQQAWAELAPVPSSTGTITMQSPSGECIDNNGNNLANNNKIDIWSCNNSAAQNWAIQPGATIQNAGSSYCIGVKAGATTNGSLTILYSCNAHTDQEWIPQSNGTLLNLKSGKCLDDPSDSTTNGTQQQIWTCNTNPQQNWTLP